MPKNKIILAVGFFIALLPFLGFPSSWDSFFEFAGGFSIVLLSVMISIDKRLSLKDKMNKRQARKRALLESIEKHGEENNSSNPEIPASYESEI